MSFVSEVRAKFSATADGMRNTVRGIREDIQDMAQDTNRSLGTTNTSMNEMQDGIRDIERTAETGMQGASNAMKDFGDTAQNETKNVGNTTDQVGKKVTGLRTTLLGLAGAVVGVTVITGAMGGAIVASEQYQQGLNQLQAQTGATDEETKGLGESMRNIYAQNYGQDFQDIAMSMADVKNATGLVGEALERATINAIALRDTFGYEVKESTGVANQMMKQFGITSDEAFELIAQGAQSGLDKNDDMLDSFNEYSVYFKQLGFDAEGMWNVFKAGSDAGAFNMDKVGDAVKEFGIRVKDGSEASKDAFKGIGLDADDMAQKFAKGGTSAQEAFSQTMMALSKIEDPVKRNTIGVALFGTQFEDLEHKTITALGSVQSEANKSGQAMEKINEVKYDSVTQALQGMGRQIVTSVILPIQDKVMPTVNKMVSSFSENLPQIKSIVASTVGTIGDTFQRLAPTFENVFGILKNVAPAILTPLGIAFKGLSAVLPPIANGISGIVEKFTGLSGFAPILAGIITAFTTYRVLLTAVQATQVAWGVVTKAQMILTNAWRMAVMALNSAWLANPIVLIIALLAGLGVALYMAYQKSETFRNIVNKAWEGIKAGFQATIDWFTITLPAWVQSVIQWFGQLWNDTKAKAVEWGNAIKGVWDAVKLAVSNFVTGVITWFNNLKTSVGTIVTSFVETVKTLFTNFVNNVKFLIEPFINFFIQSWENLKLMVLGIVGVLTSMLVGDFEGMKLGVLAIWTAIKNQISNIVNTLKDFILRYWALIKTDVLKIGNAIKDGAIKAWNALKDGSIKAVTALKDGAINAWNALKNGIINGANALKDGAIRAWEALKTGAINSVNALKTGAVNAWNSLKSSIQSAVDNIKSGVTNGFNNAKTSAVNAINNMKTGISNTIETIKGFFPKMMNSIINTIKGINLSSIGSDLLKGLLNGITSGAKAVYRKAQEIADGIKSRIKKALDINSPSRVMEGFGINVGEGLRNGIGSMIRGVAKTSEGMANAVTGGMNLGGLADGVMKASAYVKNEMILKHLIDLSNVPDHMSEASLIKSLMQVLGNPAVRRKIDKVNADNSMGYNRPLGMRG